MAAIAIDLIAALRTYRLLTADHLASLDGLSLPSDAGAVARMLVQCGWLTSYQANELFLSRGAQLLLGSYVLLEPLGAGGMGQVFKARNWKLDQIVALKLIHKERLANPQAVKRFQREIRAAAQLHHPHIVRALDADEVDGTHFFVMEYVEGCDLARVVKADGPLDVRLACEFVRQAALGLAHAHQAGLVHRDIKPANLVLVSGAAENGTSPANTTHHVKILDMGLARIDVAPVDEASSTVTQEGAVFGSPDYIAPEQGLDAHSVDIRADLYSLGCTFYFLLAGQPPFPGGTFLEKLIKHQLQPPTPLRQRRSEVPAAVEAVVEKLMAKQPADRFQTPAELAHTLAAIMSSDAIMASPAPRDRRVPSRSVPARNVFAQDPSTDATVAVTAEIIKPKSPPRSSPNRGLKLGLAAAGGLAVLAFLAVMLWSFFGPAKPVPPDDPLAFGPKHRKRTAVELAAEEAARKPKLRDDLLSPRGLSAQEARKRQEDDAQRLGVPVQITNSVGIKLVRIPPGKFLMGSSEDEPTRQPNEVPQHAVTITRPFYIGVCEVTQAEYAQLTGNNPAKFNQTNGGGPDHPVEMVSWQEAVLFCRKLSALPAEKSAGCIYRLPTEAEWEYACRAGSITEYHFGSDESLLPQYDWYLGPAVTAHRAVGQLLANAWGLRDMHGNVAEWCTDWYAETYHDARATDPPGPATGTRRAVRGGSWRFGALRSRSAARVWCTPEFRNDDLGFRVVCDAPPAPNRGPEK